jgi:hypothetical protein
MILDPDPSRARGTMTDTPVRLCCPVAALIACALLLGGPALAQERQPAAGAPAAKPTPDSAAALDESRNVRRQGNTEGQASQKRIDEISNETETLFSRYSNSLRQIDSIRVYNRQMQDLVDSQEAELASLRDQLDRVELVGRSVTPLMLRMIDAIEAFVDLDIPFLIDERTGRVAELHQMMARADVTNAEKYRRIMEAYQIENEFGRTIEAYRGTLDLDGREVTVDFLRFGRIALVYQSLDESESGVWNQATRAWEPLDSGYRSSIRKGLRIARKQAAPDLIRLPLPVPVDAGRAS